MPVGSGVDVGYFAIPVIPSFEGIEAKINEGFGTKFGAAGTKAGQEIGKGIVGGLDAKQAAVKAALDKYTTLYNKHADTLGRVKVAQAQLNDLRAKGAADTRVLAASERLEAARRKEAASLKQATDAQKMYDDAQKRSVTSGGSGGFSGLASGAEKLFGSLTKATGALGPMGGALAGVADSAGGVGTSLLAAGAAGGVAGAGVALATTALSKVLEIGPEVVGKLYDIGASFNEMSNDISFKTGLTGDALGKLTNSVETVAQSTPGTISQIGSVAAEVTRSLHSTGGDLEEITKSITNLNIKTGEATNIRDLGKAFRGFGVDAKDQNNALNELYTASTSTGQSVNDLIHAVTVGGAPLRELGLDFGRSAALMSSFENAGLDGTKMVTGLRKSVAEFAKEHKDIPKALADSVTQLKQFKDAGDEANGVDLANKLFGPKTGVQFWDAIKSGALDLDSLSGGLQGTTLSINDMADQTETAGEKWQKLKNNIEVAVQPFATKLFDITQTGLTDLTNWVETHKAEIVTFFVDVGQAAIKMGEIAAQGASQTMHVVAALGEQMSSVMKAIGVTLADAGSAASHLPGVMGQWGRDFQKFGENIESAGATGQKAFNDMNTSASWLSNFATNTLPNASTQLQTFGQRTEAQVAQTEKWKTSFDHLSQSIQVLPDGKTVTIKDNSPEVAKEFQDLGFTVQHLPDGTMTVRVAYKDQNGQAIDPSQLVTPARGPAFPGDVAPNVGGGREFGGIFQQFAFGKMPSQALIQPATRGLVQWAEPSTHGEAFIPLAPSNRDRSQKIWAEVGKRLGVLQMDSGGIAAYDAAIAEAQKIGDNRPYDYGGVGPRFDCSGAQSDIYAVMTGKPTGTRYFTTESDFAALGFKKGYMPGAYNIGVHNGGGGMNSHMAATLPNGVNFESGGAHNSTLYGKGAAGANDPQFENHYYLAAGGNPSGGATGAGNAGGSAFGAGGYYTGGSGSGGGGGTAGGAGTPGIGPNGQAGRYVQDPIAVQKAEQRVTDADNKVKDAEAKLNEHKKKETQLDIDKKNDEVTKAKAEAQTAREELAKAQQGKFVADKATGTKATTGGKKTSSAAGGQNPGEILMGGILQTFGLDGSWLPDIKNLGIVKLLGAISKIGFTPQEGTTGSTDASGTTTGGTDLGGGGSGLGALGSILGVDLGAGGAAPGPTTGETHTGLGALSSILGVDLGANTPGPPPAAAPAHVDQSTHVHINNPQGDPNSIAKHTRRALLHTPRLNTYAPPGTS